MQITNKMSKELCFKIEKKNIFNNFEKIKLSKYKEILISICINKMYDCIFYRQYDLKIGQELLNKGNFLKSKIKLIDNKDEKILQDVLDFYNENQ